MSATSQLRHNPNFPINLDIHPSTHSRITHLGILNGNFGFDEQKIAIREYGIAGRVWYLIVVPSVFILTNLPSFFAPQGGCICYDHLYRLSRYVGIRPTVYGCNQLRPAAFYHRAWFRLGACGVCYCQNIKTWNGPFYCHRFVRGMNN